MRGTTLTADRIAEIKARAIDLSDIRELTEEDFSRGHFRNKGGKEAYNGSIGKINA